MPTIVALRDALSSQLIKRITAASYPVLTPAPDGTAGKILLGRQEQFGTSAPPRVIMTPLGSPAFGGAQAFSATPGMGSSEGRLQIVQRPLLTEFQRFEFRCWGRSPSADPTVMRDDDFTYTEALYEMLMQAMVAPAIENNTGPAVLGPMTNGGWTIESGAWTDASFDASQSLGLGREYVFTIRVAKPILDRLYEFAPSNVTGVPTTSFTDPAGDTGQGCGG